MRRRTLPDTFDSAVVKSLILFADTLEKSVRRTLRKKVSAAGRAKVCKLLRSVIVANPDAVSGQPSICKTADTHPSLEGCPPGVLGTEKERDNQELAR